MQHSTSHHISHRTIIHIKSLHHMSAHHSTCPHSTSHHTMHIATFKYKLHITLHTTHSTHSKAQHTSYTAFRPSFYMSNWASNHSTSLSIPQPHFTSCISTPPQSPCRVTTPFHIHHISHLTLHDITASHHWCRTYSTLPLISPHHSHIRVNKAQHPTSGIAKHCTSHQIPHHAVWSDGIEIREMWCDMDWCAVPEMWFDVKYWAVVVRWWMSV